MDKNGTSPVISVLLLVAVTVSITIGVAYFATTFTEISNLDEEQAYIEITDTSSGVELTPITMGSPVQVLYNGQRLSIFDDLDVGKTSFIPAATGDKIQIISSGKTETLIGTEEIEHTKRLAAYYRFESNNSTVTDYSTNSNTGQISGDPKIIKDNENTGFWFDGNDYVVVDNFQTENQSDFTEVTVFIEYKINDSTGNIQQLLEHNSDGLEWRFETQSSDPTTQSFGVGSATGGETITEVGLAENETHIIAGTYNGKTQTFYANGEKVGSISNEEDFDVDKVTIAIDSDQSSQELNGAIYEIRIYNRVLSDAQINQTISHIERTG